MTLQDTPAAQPDAGPDRNSPAVDRVGFRKLIDNFIRALGNPSKCATARSDIENAFDTATAENRALQAQLADATADPLLARIDKLTSALADIKREDLRPVEPQAARAMPEELRAAIRAKALEEAARVVEANVEASGRSLSPRGDGNIAGLPYATAIRALIT